MGRFETLTTNRIPDSILPSKSSVNLDNGIRRALPRFSGAGKGQEGAVLIVPTTSNKEENENQTLKELHRISEQLDELVRIIRDITENTERTDVRPSSSDNEVMTVKEAAALMRISLPKMYEFAKSGKVHALEVGRRILISRSSLMSLLQEGE